MPEYIKEIAIFLIFSQVIVSLVTKKEYVKYIRMFLGAVMIVLIMKPVNKFLNGAFDFDNIVKEMSYKQQVSELEKNISNTDEYISMQARSAYSILIKEGINDILKESGMVCAACNVEFKETDERLAIGEISVKARKIKNENELNIEIEDVVIDVSGKDNAYTTKEGAEIRKQISEAYNISEDNIYVSVGGNINE